ncbi:MBL fold metallo-hydrolase [Wansuia hejianensis]|uniref:MBL fold metallo-hydrolase n=1 Tax=Wansuia hejianensis TaxID=2763667 RepID=A0A926EZB7_9FIRM|nr:MBL fold metallo-hydrolase [Wansuia hejianensis]MBC8590421.1 MBL fold metallo-hydrolase [Wansuia hejianensis]
MKIQRIPAGIYAANCYIIYCHNTKEGIIVDPGGDADTIIENIKNNKIEIKYIVLTHGHGDHIGAVKELKDELDVPLLAHEDEQELLKNPNINLSATMAMGAIELEPDILLKDKDIIEFGNLKGEVIHTPGHTRGGICLKLDDYLISGDTLFKGSIGRTDLLGGNYKDLMDSIKNKILILDENTIVLPGHGQSSTILDEKLYNPFLN